MMRTRAKLLVALVASVLVLLGSIGIAVAVGASGSGTADPNRSRDRDSVGMMDRDYRGDDATYGGGMMGNGGVSGNRGMMGDGWMMGSGDWSQDTWNSSSGGGWSGHMAGPLEGWQGSGPVTADQARAEAQKWVAQYSPGAAVDDGVSMPMGYMFTVSEDAHTVAVVMVDEDSGSVAGHLWTASRSGQ